MLGCLLELRSTAVPSATAKSLIFPLIAPERIFSLDMQEGRSYIKRVGRDGATKELPLEVFCPCCGHQALASPEIQEVSLEYGVVHGVLEGWRWWCSSGCRGSMRAESKHGSRWLEMYHVQEVRRADEASALVQEEIDDDGVQEEASSVEVGRRPV